MLPATNKGIGMNIGFPDVCNTFVGVATSPMLRASVANQIRNLLDSA